MTESLARATAEQISLAGLAGAPLHTGLRAAAEAYGSSRIRWQLELIATELEAGRSLEQVLSCMPSLPEHIRALIQAAAKSRDLGLVVLEISEHRKRHQELVGLAVQSILYPAFLIFAAFLVFTFLMIEIVPQFHSMFSDFQLKLPAATELVIWWSQTGIWILLAVLATVVGMVIAFRLLLPKAMWRFLVTTIPFFGPMWLWSGTAEWVRWMHVLLSQELPLPESLRLAAIGAVDAAIGQASQRTADNVTGGVSLSASLWREPRFPPSMIPFIIAGEKTNSLSDAFRTLAELFEDRVRDRANVLRMVLPPVAAVFVILSVISVIPSLLLPLVSVLTGLAM